MNYLFSQTPYKHENILHIKLNEIKFLNFKKPKFKKYQAIIFTSKNGVKSLAHLFDKWKNLDIFVIGEVTKNEVVKLGTCNIYTSTSAYGDEFAKEILPLLKDKKVLIVRAKKVVSNIAEILSNKNIKTKEIITYKNIYKKDKEIKKPPKNSTLIFTAPSNIKCFLKHFKLKKSYKIICIGKKTAQALPKNTPFFIPKIQSIEECVKLSLEI